MWPLPPVQLEYPPGLDRYRLFAVHLLRGDVFPALAEFAKVLLAPPATMTKSWARWVPRQSDSAGICPRRAVSVSGSERDVVFLLNVKLLLTHD